jgi:hypothetical protein
LPSSEVSNFYWRFKTKTVHGEVQLKPKELNIYAPVPGAHHVFSIRDHFIVCGCFVRSEDKDIGDLESKVSEAIDRGEGWLIKHLAYVRVEPAVMAVFTMYGGMPIEIGAFLVRLYHYREGNEEQQQKIVEEIRRQVELLGAL